MDVFALLFIVSFLALIFTLVVMHIRKGMSKGMGDFMSIQELLQAAKDIEVTSEQIARLRNLLEEQGKQENLKSSTSSNELLSRTYSL